MKYYDHRDDSTETQMGGAGGLAKTRKDCNERLAEEGFTGSVWHWKYRSILYCPLHPSSTLLALFPDAAYHGYSAVAERIVQDGEAGSASDGASVAVMAVEVRELL